MPGLFRNYLANKLRQNWTALDPSDGSINDIDDSLTNLDWLQNIGNKSWTSTNTHKKMQVNPNKILNVTIVNDQGRSSYEYSSPCSPVSNINQRDYSTNRDMKPSHSYAALIFMAIETADRRKLTLSSIYDWIKQNFPYYKDAVCGWKNSIRHTLTMNKCFVKVPRENHEPGKGSFWRINPTYAHLVKTESFERKIYSDNLPTAKRFCGKKYKNTLDIKQLKLVENDPCLTFPTSQVDDNAIPVSDLGSFLNQDIETDVIKIKSEQLIDSSDDDADFPLVPSPPVSSADTENIGIDEYFASFTSSLHHDDSVDTSLNSSDTSFSDSLADSCDAEIILTSWWNDVSIDCENENPASNSTRNSEFELTANQTNDSPYNESSEDFTWFSGINASFDLSEIFNR